MSYKRSPFSARDYLAATAAVRCPGCGTTEVSVQLFREALEERPVIATFDTAGGLALGYDAAGKSANSLTARRRLVCANPTCDVTVDMQPADLLVVVR